MIKREQQLKRALLLLAVVVLAYVGLGFRLVDLQVLRHDELADIAEKKMQRTSWRSAKRGDILDVNKNPLATSNPVKTICADPSMIGGQQAIVARALSPLLKMNEAEICQRLTPHIRLNSQGESVTNGLRYVRLTNNVSEETWAKIQTAMGQLSFGVNETNLAKNDRLFLKNLRLYAITAESDELRSYPNDALAGQVLGFVSKEENTNHTSSFFGRDGIEKAFDDKLRGVYGWRKTGKDKRGNELVSQRNEDVEARDGLNVVLTIDSAVQHIVETALAEAWPKYSPKSITGIVMRPHTGEILAMVSLPNYDPDKRNTITPETRNRVITDVVEPGSTFKIVVVSGALNNGTVKLDDQFDCEHGHFAFAGRVLHDHESLGIETVKGIITKSSNIGAAKIGIKLGEQSLYDYAWNFGFGQRTGIPLPGEVRGVLYPVKQWSKVSIAQIPMGHGVAVTRLQMLFAMAAIANDGWLMRPMIVNRLEESDGGVVQRYVPERVRQVVSENAARQMIEALKTVPMKGGTAPEAQLKNYVVAGKTGTAQVAENGHYVPGKFVSSFIGFFPADNPELCISVVVEEPKENGYYGGKVCGPVFREIAERCASYLNIPPDPKLMTNAPPLMADSGRK